MPELYNSIGGSRVLLKKERVLKASADKGFQLLNGKR
jgi:hypothetical protein